MAQSPGQRDPAVPGQEHYREAALLARRAAGYEGAPGEARAQDARLAIACALLAIAAALTGEDGQ